MKTVCVYHSIDLDGWMSAAIVKHWFLNDRDGIDEKYRIVLEEGEDYVSKTINRQGYSLDFVGYNYGQPILDLSEYDKIIMCDISFPKENMLKLRLGEDGIHGKNMIWLDHHISAINDLKEDIERGVYIEGIRDTKYAACELTWKYFFPYEPMPEIIRLLGRYDCFGHKGTNEEQKVLEFQYGARMVIGNHIDAYKYLITNINYGDSLVESIHRDGSAIYRYLCTEAKQSYKNGVVITFERENTSENDIKNYFFICVNKERFNPINFGIDYHKEGYDGAACFHFDGQRNAWAFSLYNDNGLVDCSQIAKQFGGGGHKGAAGFVLKNIEDLIRN